MSPASSADSRASSTDPRSRPAAAATRSAWNSDPITTATSRSSISADAKRSNRALSRLLTELTRRSPPPRLQGQQWVAASCGVHLLCGPAAPCLGEEPGDVFLGEGRQADHLDAGLAAELGEESGQRVVEIGGRVSAREHEQRWRSTAQAGEVPQRIARRRRRPVHVLDDNEQRSLACGAIQIVPQRRKDLRPLDRSFRLRPRRSEREPRR